MAEFPDNDTIVEGLESVENGVRELREAIGNADIVQVADALENILKAVDEAAESFAVDLNVDCNDNK